MSADRAPQLPGGTSEPPGRRTILYYRNRGVIVTSRYLVVGAARYDLDELAELMRTRGSLHPGVIVGMVTAVAEAAIVAPLVGAGGAPEAWLLAGVALLIPCLVGLVCARRWPAQFELLARYRGRQIMLFATRDQYEFGQVARAVQRALEAADEVR